MGGVQWTLCSGAPRYPIKFLRLIYHSQHPSGARVHSGERLLVPSPKWQDHDHLKYYPVLVTSRIFHSCGSFSIGPMVAHWCSDHCQWVSSGRPVGCQKKQWWSWAVGGRWASCQCPDSRISVGCPLVKPSADLWGFVRWATTNPLTTAAAASGSSVDSQTISGGPPLTRQLMYMTVDEMVLSC